MAKKDFNKKPICIKALAKRSVGKKGRFANFGLYECPACKNRFESRVDNINSGNTTKCRKCSDLIDRTRHGDAKKTSEYHRLHLIWKDMIARCSNKNLKCYKHYGGRGIAVCESWLNYPAFKFWSLDNGYNSILTIDRTDNNKGYSPTNCRWATMSMQLANQRKREGSSSRYVGVYFDKSRNKWSAQLKYEGKNHHIGRFDNEIDGVKARDAYIISKNLPHTLNL